MPSTPDAEKSNVTARSWHLLVPLLVAVAGVVGLFAITVASSRPAATSEVEAAPRPRLTAAQLPPLAPLLAAEVVQQQAQLEGRTGAARVEGQRDIIAHLAESGRRDYAALLQRNLAEATGNIDDWWAAADLWMQVLEQERLPAAVPEAVTAFETVVAAEPDNLEAQTDLATVYLSSKDPMKAVATIKQVLTLDSTYVPARYNYGVMLALIGRDAEAIVQFNQVLQYAAEDTPYIARATSAIQSLAR